MDTKDIPVGKFLGYQLVLKDVPVDRAKHLEKIAPVEYEKMFDVYIRSITGI